MQRIRLQTATGLLLSASLLCGSLVPPAQRHAHAGGDLAHDHQHQPTAIGHGHHDHDHHHHPHHRHVDRQQVLQSTAIAHAHVSLWLIELMTPLGDGSDSEPDDDARFLSRLGEDWVPTTVRESLGHTPGVPPPVADLAAVVPDATAVQIARRPPVVDLLCDRARHERSGVQLF